ncbi:MAG: hypothetical protein JNJ71_21520 [Rubrivivax sp.]|nr:hypothetical protein [Rubrivivax sp.]
MTVPSLLRHLRPSPPPPALPCWLNALAPRRALAAGALWLGLLGLLASTAQAQPAPELSAAEAQRDLRILQRALTELHPGLYRHATPAQISDEFDAAQAAVAQGASRAQMVLLASRIAAAVRCGHTWVSRYNQSSAVQALVTRQTLPLVLRWLEGRVLVLASAVPEIAAGSELTAIDGRTPAEIAAALLPYLRADGSADGKRLSQLDDDNNGGAMQRLFPLLFPPGEGGWRVRVLAPGARAAERTVAVPPLTAAQRTAALQATGHGAASNAWSLTIDGGLAVMTLPTFALWDRAFDGNAWLSQAFTRLAEQQVRQLIIDLRANEGGNDGFGRALLAHLLTAPFTQPGGRRESAYERAPYGLARFLETWDFGFFDRTGQVSKGPGRNWLMPDLAPVVIAPAAPRFAGQVLALVGPQNSSAGFLLARDLQRLGTATLMGQPTGGSLRGLNGGQIAWLTLPASGVAVDIPLVATFAPGDPPDAGVWPDVLVLPRFADAQVGHDTTLDAARAWLQREAQHRSGGTR